MEDFDYWLITTGPESEPGINGGLGKRSRPADPEAGNNAFFCTIQVDSLEKTRQKILENGGKVFSEAGEIPEVGIMQPFFDTEGNFFGVLEGEYK